MPEQSQQIAAAASSARVRVTARLLRELLTCRPLTAEQRDQLVRAAAGIQVVDR